MSVHFLGIRYYSINLFTHDMYWACFFKCATSCCRHLLRILFSLFEYV